MATATENAIQQIYIGLLGRSADPDGLAYWAAEIDGATLTLEQLRANIVNEQPEYAAGQGLLTRVQTVDALYQNMFERAAETEGLDYWVSGGGASVNIDQLVLALINGASASDQLVLDNKTDAAIYYTENTAQADFTTDAATSSVKDVDSTSESVDASKAATDSDSQTAGQTFNLTTGIDDINGSQAGDTINGVLNSGATIGTLTALDNIDGGTGDDVFNVAVTTSAAVPSAVTVANVETANIQSVGAIGAAGAGHFNVSGWAGLTTANLTAVGASFVTAAATTDVNELTSVAASTISGGKDVTVVHVDATTAAGAATDVLVNSAVAAAGAINVTSSATVLTAGQVAGDITVGATSVAASLSTGAVTISGQGDMTVFGGATIDATVSNAVTLADRTTHLATQTATAADILAGTGAAAGTTTKDADVAAQAVVTGLGVLTTAYAHATNSDSIAKNNALTLTQMKSGVITQAAKVSIDAAYKAAHDADTGNAAAKADAGEAAALVVTTALVVTATAAKVVTAAALAAAVIVDTAADTVVTADVATEALTKLADLDATESLALTSVSVSGNYGNGAVELNTITDGSALKDKLTTVTLDNAGSANITSNALATVNVSNAVDTTDVVVVNSTVDNTLALNLNTADIDLVNAADTTKTLNVVATGTNVLDVDATTVSAINISGTGNTTVIETSIAAAAVITNTSTGNVTMTVADTHTYVGGAGVDTVTIGANDQAKSVDGGAGTADVVVITNSASLVDNVGTTTVTEGYTQFKNFEILSAATGVSADVSKFTNSAITGLAATGTVTFSAVSAAQAANVSVTGTTALTLGVAGADGAGQIDTVNIATAANAGAALGTGLNLADVEILNLTTTTAATTLDIDGLANAASLTGITVTGAGNLDLITLDTLTNTNYVIDASAVTGTVVVNAAGASSGAALTIKGSLTNGNTITSGSDASETSLLVGGAAKDTITGAAGNDTIQAGEGNNILDGINGANTITAGDGHNTITGGAGVDTVTVGNGFNIIDTEDGNDVITVGTGGNAITGGLGADAITAGTTAAGVVNTYVQGLGDSVSDSANTTTGTIAATQTVTFGAGVDVITGFDALGGDTIDTDAAAGAAVTLIGQDEATLTDNKNHFASGAYDANTGVFTIAADGTGADTMIMSTDAIDAGVDEVLATNVSTIILVGVDSDDLSAATFI